ncbi:MAG TPA: non-homologous end-joining DNA ligase [Verrucomicrobiae bacterium]|nr:non-homologous end-joining DNA ligase [Verrucomicrobiae bacterium]
MGLKEYKAKRNFRQTSEPEGAGHPSAARDDFFVIQKHDATRLHYDFRLAMAGVLKSWAVPKGFPAAKGERHLAVEVEDHPLDYARFEGTIPKGNYGAGTVMVWDIGTYEVLGGDPRGAVKNGKLHFILKGKKLKGEWALVRMKPRPGEDKPQWLLFKADKDARPISARAEDQSVLTRRSLQQIAIDNDAQWQSNRIAERAQKSAAQLPTNGNGAAVRTAARAPRKASSPAARADLKTPRLPARPVEFAEPMKALMSERLPKGEQWIYELKFDGVRGLALKRNDSVRLISRNEKDLTSKYPEISAALRTLPAREAILDGEVVALDETGKSSFQLLQAANMPGEPRPPIFYYVFDVLQLDGKDLTALPLLKRKAMVETLLADAPDTLRFSAGIPAQSERVLNEMKARGLEGLIAKQRDSKYEIGRRSGAWVKFKWTNEQEFVIGGYTEPQGSRSHFGALLIGYYAGNKLQFCSKVGTGFNEKLLKSMFERFQELKHSDCPFANLPEKKVSSRWGRPFTAAEMRRCTWVEPKLVCQVRFAEWTRDGHLRQPAFVGLREDKNPRDVVREKGG